MDRRSQMVPISHARTFPLLRFVFISHPSMAIPLTHPQPTEEKALPSQEERNAKAARRARKSSDASSPSPSPPPSPTPRRQDRPTKVKGLTKQTYSAYVTPPGSSGPPKKWHLTAYFSSSDYHELPVVNEDPVLRTITVPADVYVTGKGLTRKNNTRGVSSAATSTRTASVAPPPPPPSAPSDGSRSPWSSASSDPMPPTPPQPPMHFYPTPPAYTYDTGRYPICSPPLAPGYITSDVRGEYPPVSVPAPAPQPPSPGARYSARHTLDQRALGAFRITL